LSKRATDHNEPQLPYRIGIEQAFTCIVFFVARYAIINRKAFD